MGGTDVLAVIEDAADDLRADGYGHKAKPLDDAQNTVADLMEAMDELLTHTIGCEILLKVHETDTVVKAKAALCRAKGGSP